MAAIYRESANDSVTNSARHVRFVHDAACTITVPHVIMSTTADDNLNNTIAWLRANGYNRTDRRYLVFVDAGRLCGQAELWLDDSHGPGNLNETMSMIARLDRDTNCWTGAVAAHEHMHTMGAVQASAPHSTGQYGHCTDEYDRMCYTDESGLSMSFPCTASTRDRLFDCRHDDYFSTASNPGTYLSSHWNTADNRFLLGGFYYADVNGDGLADAVVVDSNHVRVKLSTGSGFGPESDWSNNVYFGTRGEAFADVTGDGKADAIVVNDVPGITVRRSSGTVFGANESWTTNPYYGGRGTFFADVTGDGKADAIAVNSTGITVRRSSGALFSGNETWTSNAYYGSKGNFFADVTGDGRADAIVVNDTGITVRRSSGSAFSSNEAWTTNAYYGSRGTFFADVTGDGRADAIVVNDTGITVRRSTGTLFSATYETWSSYGYYGYRGTAFVDVGNSGLSPDRRADVVAVNENSLDVRRSNGTLFSSTENWFTGSYY